jgi:hypothetical protein
METPGRPLKRTLDGYNAEDETGHYWPNFVTKRMRRHFNGYLHVYCILPILCASLQELLTRSNLTVSKYEYLNLVGNI